MDTLRLIPLLILAAILTGCADSPPRNPENLCAIYKEKKAWYNASLKTQKRWNVPPQVPMAMMYQESSFNRKAQPPRRYLLGIIPWKRPSSAYGFSQAKDETWGDYVKETGNHGARRSDFADSIDFMGWYIDKAARTNGISRSDAYAQYLNYHEGMAGYRRKTYQSKTWLVNTSRKVNQRASTYGSQYRGCKAELDRNRGFWSRLFN